ncbi:cell division ATP-binding protein FtsE [Thermithiobacillus plumbiphilus]|uniref:Cell division ATP-binding protein FtsE n=1 Tax=Thermithiobacillus plumbiphilus TaxID=1729899 RepID=A0ABU9D9X8_9PROT
MIRANKVCKIYPGRPAVLQDLDFHLPRGGMAFLTGASGAGKSTLLKLVTRAETLTGGSLFVDGQDLGKLKARQVPRLRRTMGIVFQDYRLLMDRNVYDNVALTLEVAGVRHSRVRPRVHAALEQVGLAGRAKDRPQQLSGGEQQRAAIARAIVHNPKLLIADEPTGNLDPDLSREIMDLFSHFNQLGVTVLIATHDLALIERMTYPIFVLQSGQLRLEGERICA